MDRVIGRYKGNSEGPLIIVLGAMHGNEPAGVSAIQEFFRLLNSESENQSGLLFHGEIVGIIGNIQAFQKGRRFIKYDLNRSWTQENINRINNSFTNNLKDEDLEMKEIIQLIFDIIEESKRKKMYVLDIHTTSSDSAIFSIPSLDPESQKLAQSIQAPVILGLTEDLSGTSLHYFNTSCQPIPTVAIGLESGHHADPESVQRGLSAIIQLLHHLEVYKSQSRATISQSAQTEVFEVVYRHHVEDITQWRMLPGYHNFQFVRKEETLAIYRGEKIFCPCDGRLLMPLYQSQGQDGFFIIKETLHC